VAAKLRKFTPLFIILGGILIMMLLVMSRKKPERQTFEVSGALVDVMIAERTDETVDIKGYGTVTPRYQVALQPQVAGKIEWVHPDLVAGGYFRDGQVMARIEQIDYKLAVSQAEANVAQAQYQLDLSKANAGIAQREWEMMNSSSIFMDDDSTTLTADPLVLYEPQLKQAEAGYKSAKAMLKSAKLNLSRTEIKAPYNCKVSQTGVSPGQIINSAVPIAQVYSTDIIEIFVSMPQSDLEWIEIPGARATVKLNTGSDYFTWEGEVDRSIGVLDQVGRLEQIVVRINDPFDNDEKPDLSIGSFVQVDIDGKLAENIISIPRKALRENNAVWIANGDELLIKTVDVLRLTPEKALIRSGIEEGDQIVLTALTGASNGTKLRIKDQADVNGSETATPQRGEEN